MADSLKWTRNNLGEYHATVYGRAVKLGASRSAGSTCKTVGWYIEVDGEYITTRRLLSQAKRRAIEAVVSMNASRVTPTT